LINVPISDESFGFSISLEIKSKEKTQIYHEFQEISNFLINGCNSSKFLKERIWEIKESKVRNLL